ncbi:MAG: long-chain-acyl-CoA synthetase [Sandaracinaceae bacterium]|jgi:fatty-acyl-CoA synthase|nr:long-chain-acyl-CoA synthetase [Sandaracinaceae bacterium]MBP7686129.1 long-chain-acyl-CoA synthetase [Deltaproteobacteria bacterium]MBK7153416.1 long-chain-acyl-CoA synthetase [Sandaracinaceae bacterium]MBK7772678.1 long-chain-acyl-CoA synthetase [Sandaracinaceae bacterium]MBK8406882.1 long-chain-acyl-CoA synthetase [Sandaracinaceae bacterium]
MKRSPAPLAILKDVITGAAQNAAHAEWRDSVRAELSLLPRLAGKTLPTLVQMKRGTRTTLLEVLQENAREAGHELALEMGDQRLTWRTLERLTSRIAHVLRGLGVRKGDVVALVGTNSPLYVALVLGCTRVGATTAMINSNLRGRPLSHALLVSKANVVLVEASLAAAVAERDDLHALRVMTFGRGELETELDKAPAAPFPPAPVSVDDDFIYIYTSGTTGMPKPCRISHGRALSAAAGFGPLMFDWQPGDKLYCVLPLYHANGFMIGIGGCIMARVPVALRATFSATQFWSDVKRYRATAMIYIGELCRYLVNTPEHPDERDNTLRVAVGNGLRSDVWGPFQERFGIADVREFYAATEAPGFLLNFSGKRGSVGRMPFGGMGWMRLAKYDVEADDHVRDAQGFCVESTADEPGELLVKLGAIKTPATEFRGYTDAAATSKKVLRNVFEPGDEYFRSGDLLRRDDLGFYYFVDRIGDTYRWRGENVSTAEVADVLAQTPNVAEATVVGVRVPSQEGACGLVAVVLDPGKKLDLAALRKEAESLPAYARPRFVRVQSALELTGTFKVQKNQLKHDGADPAKVADPLFVLIDDAYVPLTAELWAAIGRGEVRL